jgi:SPOR domain
VITFNGHFLSVCLLLLIGSFCLWPDSAGSQTLQDYAVEVAALRSQESATELTNGLQARGLEAYLVEANPAEHGTYFRVRVGRFQNLDTARNYAEEMLDAGLLDTCAITAYEAPVNPLVKMRPRDSLKAALLNAATEVAYPVPLPGKEKGSDSPGNTKELIDRIGQCRWLLDASKKIVYTLPPLRPSEPVQDVVLLMRSIYQYGWRLNNQDISVLKSSRPSRSPSNPANMLAATDIDSSIASSLSSLRSLSSTITAAVRTNAGEGPTRLTVAPTTVNTAAATVNSERRAVPDIKRPGTATPAREVTIAAPPRLQGSLVMTGGQMVIKIKNLDQQRSFAGSARVTLSDDQETNEVAPVSFNLLPNEEKIVPVDQNMRSGEWMLMVFDQRQAVQLIRSAPFGRKPAPAQASTVDSAESSPWTLAESSGDGPVSNRSPNTSGLPNVTGIYDATAGAKTTQVSATPEAAGRGTSIDPTISENGPGNNQQPATPALTPGQVTVVPRQIAATGENIMMELDISAPQPLNYIKVSVRSGRYQDERYALLSSTSGRIPFLVPVKQATGEFTFEIKDDSNTVLATGSGNFSPAPRSN